MGVGAQCREGARMITGILPFQIQGAHFTCEMQYDEDHPYELTFIFRISCQEADCTDTHEQTWIIGRDLLAEGADSELWVGEGDVKLRRNAHNSVEIALQTRENNQEVVAIVTVPRRPLRDFISRTYGVVDAGKESERFDWDSLDAERATW